LNQLNAQALTSFICWFFVFYLYHGLGITLGYHRLLTHKAFKCPEWVKYLIVSGGYLGLMGAPIVWVGVHRLHHQKSDEPEDPHSPRDGFGHALYRWMFTMGERQTTEELHKQVPDLLSDPLFALLGADHSEAQAQLCLAMCIIFRVLIFFVLGPAALFANLLAASMVFVSTQLVNAVCHLPSAGYRSFDTREDSRNVWWVAVLACGEGWHNNHHAIPKSARHGMSWWEFDITWLSVVLLEKLGLATDVIRPARQPKTRGASAADAALAMLGSGADKLADFQKAGLISMHEAMPEPVLVDNTHG
jgi:stearoyl-CoA desaturase (delta-9 desaturase)